METPRKTVESPSEWASVVLASFGKTTLFGIVILLFKFIFEMTLQVWFGPRLESDLGFRLGSPVIRAGGWPREVMAVEEVAPGGAFARAGFRPGEVIVDQTSMGQFFLNLHGFRGGSYPVQVVSGGDGPPLAARPRRVRTVRIPR